MSFQFKFFNKSIKKKLINFLFSQLENFAEWNKHANLSVSMKINSVFFFWDDVKCY